MSIGDLFGVGVGLVVIGLFFILFDYLMVRLLVKAGASEPETWTVEATLPPETSKEDVRRYKMVRATMTHRFRRGGIVTAVVGLVVLLGSGLWTLLR
jgi:hypothetical protein